MRKVSNFFLVATIVLSSLAIGCGIVYPTREALQTQPTETVDSRNELVMIFDVYSYDTETGCISVEMPNGEIHDYYANDLPEEISEVAFATENQDDYSTYRIIALR